MSRVGVPPRVNPFSTRFVQPGAIPFRVPTPDGLAGLVRRLTETRGRGQIVGPHGSGKSTLLASLLPHLTAWRVRHVVLNTSHRSPPVDLFDSLPADTLVVIDGFEQLGVLVRWQVRRHCRRNGCGLLVTAHRNAGLPDLYRTGVTAGAARELIASLVPPGGGWVLDGFDVAARLRHNRGSLRDVLFELYDRWEAGER